MRPTAPDVAGKQAAAVRAGTDRGAYLRLVVGGRFPEQSLVVLLAMSAALTAVSAAVHSANRVWELEELVRYVNLDAEANLPTWFGSALLLLSAALLLITAFTPLKGKPGRRYWVLMAAVFLVLSIDEAARLHERLGESLQRAWETGGFLRFAWVLPYGVLGLVLLAALIPLLIALPSRTRNLFLVSGALYVLGAAGVNSLTGALIEGNPPQMA